MAWGKGNKRPCVGRGPHCRPRVSGVGERILRVEEIGKRLDDWGDYTRKCNRLVVVWEKSSGLVPGDLESWKGEWFWVVKKEGGARGEKMGENGR
jgi:hypothetical protein